MNDKIKLLAEQAGFKTNWQHADVQAIKMARLEKFAELIVKEMCSIMEQTEDDAYHCFDASERPTEYIEWLRHWQEIFTKHFGVK